MLSFNVLEISELIKNEKKQPTAKNQKTQNKKTNQPNQPHQNQTNKKPNPTNQNQNKLFDTKYSDLFLYTLDEVSVLLFWSRFISFYFHLPNGKHCPLCILNPAITTLCMCSFTTSFTSSFQNMPVISNSLSFGNVTLGRFENLKQQMLPSA